jgi:hypothetical protein
MIHRARTLNNNRSETTTFISKQIEKTVYSPNSVFPVASFWKQQSICLAWFHNCLSAQNFDCKGECAEEIQGIQWKTSSEDIQQETKYLELYMSKEPPRKGALSRYILEITTRT